MKKTLIINIGNTIIHFEEDAFEALTNYLNGIKSHFASTADNFEIVTDIENRIAEMLREMLAEQQKQVVDINDATTVMGRMGSISDFEQEETTGRSETKFRTYNEKRLFRNTEDAIIAGVCSGLGHYLNIEAKWIRLVAFISIFLGGSGVLAYIILWIIMPPAMTRAEKMAMRGEAADLQGFKRNFDEELAAFKEHVKHANTQFEPYVKRTGSMVTEFAAVMGRFIESAAKVFFKIIALFIIIMGVAFMLSLIVALAAVTGLSDTSIFTYFPMNIINEGYQDSLLLAGFITFFVPVLALVLFSIRVAFNRRAINKTLSFALLTIWLCGMSFTTYYVAKISSEFKEYAELSQSASLPLLPEYTLNMNNNMTFTSSDSLQYKLHYDDLDINNRVILTDGDHPFRSPRNVRIEIQRGESKTANLTMLYQANGKTFEVALKNARNIDYKYAVAGRTINFDPQLVLRQDANWRAQEVKLILRIPEGTILHINNNMFRYLEYYGWDCSEVNNSDYTDWVMTGDGLKCKNERVAGE
ncbi:MAG: PspC domain-containing protein [Pedobacter sp.]|nr:MAG: PspC domain-containing protein [Pedobacter sp.]